MTLPSSVTVILVSYYNNRDLRYCLPALFNTIHPATKVLLIDNATDDTDLDWIAEAYHRRIEVVRSPYNGGFGFGNRIHGSRNKGNI